MMPPMVGVPALELCQVGPSCRISCPAFSLRSSANTNRPKIIVSAKLIRAANSTIFMMLSLSAGWLRPLVFSPPGCPGMSAHFLR